MSDYDLVIRGGTVVDGSGADRFKADVAVKDGTIVRVGTIDGKGAQEIDATGRIVTPGFVDVHTHYDGQVTWETRLLPSSNHGVTTVIGGNCGVGFAPCRPEDRGALISVMEGVEDIPEIVMTTGIPWNWETFPEYLETLANRQYDIDIGMQVPHSPIRVYVMGERGVKREDSTEEDRREMRAIVKTAIEAGAIGVTTSRSWAHRAKTGDLAPSIYCADEEVVQLAAGLKDAKGGVFQLVPEHPADSSGDLGLIERIAEVSERPVSFTLMEIPYHPQVWRDYVAGIDAMQAKGLEVNAQVAPRTVGFYMGLELTLNPITTRPSYIEIADKPLAERVQIMRDPAFKAKILAEEPIQHPQALYNIATQSVHKMSELGTPPTYFPNPDDLLGARAEREGTTPLSLAYDLLLEDDGHNILFLASANYETKTDGPVREMMTHPHAAVALGDGGAHYGFVCDAGYPSFVLTYWTRQAAPEQRLSLEWAINAMSHRPAAMIGMDDRGLIAEGKKADINIIDYDHMTLHKPEVVYDLPAGGRRLWQKVDGFDATIVNGVVTQRHGKPTGALPGRLVRGTGYVGANA